MKRKAGELVRHCAVTGAVAMGLLAVACTSTPTTHPELEAARAQYQTARADPSVQSYAAEELEEAERLLSSADAAVESREDVEVVDHLAYLAKQTSRTAIELGRQKAAEQRIGEAAAERDRIRLAARTREAELANESARLATLEAERAGAAASTATRELAQTRERAADLAEANAALEALNAKQSSRGLIVTLGDMLFDTGKAEVKSGATRQLDEVATFLRENPDRQVMIEGFTDSVGADDYNQQLSDRRAAAVRDALTSRGVDGSRIVARGYGERFPVGTNADAGGRQLNRRVEIIVSNDASPVQPRA